MTDGAKVRPEGPSMWENISLARAFTRGDITPLRQVRERFGDMVFLGPPVDAYALFDPKLIHQVLAGDSRKYKKSANYQELRRVMGDGLVTSDGDSWVRQRRALNSSFSQESVRDYRRRMPKIAARFAEKLLSRTKRSSVQTDLKSPLDELSARLTSDVLFGVEGACPGQLASMIETVGRAAVGRIYSPWSIPEWMPTKENRSERLAIDAIRKATRDLTEASRTSASSSCVLRTLDPQHQRSHLDLRDALVTLTLAGQDTLSACLAWYFLLLSQKPLVQARVREELRSRSSGIEDEIPFTRATLLETLRLYPPIPVIARTPTESVELGGFSLPEGSVVLCCLDALHRHPKHFERPNMFVPERFLGEVTQHSKGAFLPFSVGPRKCIGDRVALAQAETVIAEVLRRVRLLPDGSGQRLTGRTWVSMAPKGGVPVKLRACPSYPRLPESLPNQVLSAGDYRVRFARSERELREVQRLRFRVFSREHAGSELDVDGTRLDDDEFDESSHHLLVETRSGELVGTYRLRSPDLVELSGRYYSAADFSLGEVPRSVLRQGG